jgi:hypothetical protein
MLMKYLENSILSQWKRVQVVSTSLERNDNDQMTLVSTFSVNGQSYHYFQSRVGLSRFQPRHKMVAVISSKWDDTGVNGTCVVGVDDCQYSHKCPVHTA